MRTLIVLSALSGLLSAARVEASVPILKFEHSEQTVYASADLASHLVAPECNPGGGSSCPCSEADVSIRAQGDYGTVTANVRLTNTWVNAIGYKKLFEQLPNGQPIRLRNWRYSARVRLPIVPRPIVSQRENPEAVHLMVQLWDGRNALWPANKHTLEAAVFWELNPWSAEYGKIKIYTWPTVLSDTGLRLLPDTAWHSISLTADFRDKAYVSVTVDGHTADLEGLLLAQVSHPDWGNEVALNLTTESLSAWPQRDCANVFTWTTAFQKLALTSVESRLSWVSAVGTQYQVQSSPDLRSWFNLGPLRAGSGDTVATAVDLGSGGGFLRVIAYATP